MGTLLQLVFPFLTQSLVDVGIRDGNLSFITLILVAQLVVSVSQLLVEFIRSWILLHVNNPLIGFSEQEYEGLEGDVVSISPVPNEEGNYVVEISLTRMPDNRPPVLKVMSGTAEIIIREQSLLERLFRH